MPDSEYVMEAKAQERPCPVCGSPVEPEVDGDHLYYECADDGCEAGGYAFGYERIEKGVSIGTCAAGVPEAVRRAGSLPPEDPSAPKLIAGPSLPRRI